MLTVLQVARIAHEANRAYCYALNDFTIEPWIALNDSEVDGLAQGIRTAKAILDSGRELTPESLHEHWTRIQESGQWTWSIKSYGQQARYRILSGFDTLPDDIKRQYGLYIAIISELYKKGIV